MNATKYANSYILVLCISNIHFPYKAGSSPYSLASGLSTHSPWSKLFLQHIRQTTPSSTTTIRCSVLRSLNWFWFVNRFRFLQSAFRKTLNTIQHPTSSTRARRHIWNRRHRWGTLGSINGGRSPWRAGRLFDVGNCCLSSLTLQLFQLSFR